jgi:adenine phosphoribosyltransferase
MAAHFRDKSIDAVASAEARGLVFAAPLALELNVALLPVRKPVPIPFNTRAFHYELSPYNKDALDDYQAMIQSSQRILFVDDLLASGTSTDACCRLIEDAGATVGGCAFLIELASLGGRARLAKYDVLSLINYP